jgi:hypothetical protein
LTNSSHFHQKEESNVEKYKGLMHNLPSRSVVPTLGFWNPSAMQLQNCWHTGFEYVGELDMSPLASMMASDFIS